MSGLSRRMRLGNELDILTRPFRIDEYRLHDSRPHHPPVVEQHAHYLAHTLASVHHERQRDGSIEARAEVARRDMTVRMRRNAGRSALEDLAAFRQHVMRSLGQQPDQLFAVLTR